MKKLILALGIGAAMCAAPSTASAQVPVFYGGYYAPYPMPSYNAYGFYTTPWGYRTWNAQGFNVTPWGWNAYNYGATFTRPIVNAPYHSIYLDGRGQVRWGSGYMNTPSFYQFYRFGY